MMLMLFIGHLLAVVKHVDAGYSYDAAAGVYINNNDPTLTTIPGSIPLTAVSVDLSGNAIATCTGFPSLPDLTSLGLSNNELTEFPDLRPVVASIISLDLSHNAISSFPAEFMSLSNLQSLNLNENNLVLFPDMTQMLALEVLDLFDNQIQVVPGELLSPLINLINVNLRSNGLSTFPDVYLPRLNTLRLRMNPDLTTLPVWSSMGLTITNLVMGYASMNPISLQALSALPSLTKFKLRYASVSEVPEELFLVLRGLEKFDLSGNNLKSIPDVCDAGQANVDVGLVHIY